MDIHNDMVSVLHLQKRDAAPSEAVVCKWALEFKRGRTSSADSPCSGRPKSAVTPDIVKKFRTRCWKTGGLRVNDFAEIISISFDRVLSYLDSRT